MLGRRKNQLRHKPTAPHTSPLNGSELHSPRDFIVKLLSHRGRCGSISLVRHCRSVSPENGWVQVTDPTSQEGGWVLQQYLVLTNPPTVLQTATATTTDKALSEPTRANSVPSRKKRIRATKPAVRVPDEVAIAQFDRRWERRAERRGGFGLFFFGRFARAE